MKETQNQTDPRIRRRQSPAKVFVISLVVLCVLTTLQMMIIGNYIDYRSIPPKEIFTMFGFWFLGATIFTMIITWQVRETYDRPFRNLSSAARQVAQGDFSVYLPPIHTPDKATELDVLYADFNKMVAELGSIETLKTDFFSDVSHEFKTPLAVIASNAELLQHHGGLDEVQQEHLHNIMDSTKRLSNLIQNMLKLNKLEKQTIQPVPEVYDLCAQLCECAVQYEDAWEKKNIEFEADMEDSALTLADPGLMELVWSNLFSNAMKFTPEGGTITLTQRREGDSLVVSLADTGCGMSRETMQHIFDKFYQGDTSHATRGNGLGLALVKRILELSNASITVQSEEGKGSVFTVRLPSAEEENA